MGSLRRARVISGGNDVKKEQKEKVVEELAGRLKAADTVLVADYRGLTMP